MSKPTVPVALVLALALAGCATATPGEARIDPNRITRMEIDQAGPSSAYDLIQKLRPIWLRKRGQTSFTQETDVVVYLDGTHLGERESLRTLQTDDIEHIEFLDARRATVRFGAGHVAGAILIVTRG